MTRQRARSPSARPCASYASALTGTSFAGYDDSLTEAAPGCQNHFGRAEGAAPLGAGTTAGAGPADQPSAARGCSLCGAVEAYQFLGGGGVLRGLVVAPAPGETREPHRQPGVVLDLSPAGAVGGRQGQLRAEDDRK